MSGIYGSVDVMPVRDLLFYLANRQSTGTLEVQQGDQAKTVVMVEGAAILAASTHPSEYFSNLLVHEGYVSEAQVQEAFDSGHGQYLGSFLVAAGVLGETVVRDVVALKIRRTVSSLMNWTHGTFRFSAAVHDALMPEMAGAVDLIKLCRSDVVDVSKVHDASGLRDNGTGKAQADMVGFPDHFRQQVGERLAERGRGKRFPRDLQQRAVDYYYVRTHNGSFLSEVARELDLPPPTLRRWVLDSPTRPPVGAGVMNNATPMPNTTLSLPAGLRAGAATHAANSGGGPAATAQVNGDGSLTVVGPGGFRVEGLDIDSIAALLRRLQ